MNNVKKGAKRFLNIRNVLILIIFLFVSFLWFRYIAGIILVVIFAPITFLSIRYSKMIPHISAESNTAMSLFMGYIFGPTVGFFYGIGVGGFCYLMNSFVSATYLTTILMSGVTAAIAGVLHGMGVNFANAFIIAIICRTAIAWPLFGFLGIDPFERFTHQTSQLLTNLIIYLPLMSVIYDLVSNFV